MTDKRFTIIYGLDEDPFDWDILDNEKDAIICQYNGTPICELLNELHEENEQLRHDATILIQSNQDYRKENEQLKAQLLYDGDSVCNICKHQYLVETGKYYVAKCEKEHEECSKVDLQYCEDFELVRDFE